MSNMFDVIVIGAGHAGCEAALAAARMGSNVLLLSMNLDAVALMPCNPAIGGPAKAHLVREIDALGGEMGRNINETFIQIRMLNTNKGAAVHSLRAQADKSAYQLRMKHVLEKQPNLWLRQAVVDDIEYGDDGVKAVVTNLGTRFFAPNIIVTAGTYMASRIIVGQKVWPGGPNAQAGPALLSQALKNMGLELVRFKTGTPPRVNGASVNFGAMEVQPGDDSELSFSFWTKPKGKNAVNCWLTYTTSETHKVIRDNLDRAPMYTGIIEGVGPRYCPSIEDKIVRFADKERHQLFVEPEGVNTNEYYIQGMSTSLPEDVQEKFLRSIPGLENVDIIRPGYAIEYDVVVPTQLKLTLESKRIPGLFTAGQVNGTSGYEEAAAQGLIAGINASLRARGASEFILQRSQAYIGVLIDDLTIKGTNEPYRMLTSRAEFRLLLRQDNADKRLTPLGKELGLISDADYLQFTKKSALAQEILSTLENTRVGPEDEVNQLLVNCGSKPLSRSVTLADLVRRPEIRLIDLEPWVMLLQGLDSELVYQIETELKYQGYVQKQHAQVEKMLRLEKTLIPSGLEFKSIKGLSLEAAEKLHLQQPQTLGQASRISGVSPADISLVSLAIKHRGGK